MPTIIKLLNIAILILCTFHAVVLLVFIYKGITGTYLYTITVEGETMEIFRLAVSDIYYEIPTLNIQISFIDSVITTFF